MNTEHDQDARGVDSIPEADGDWIRVDGAGRPSMLKDFAVQWWPIALIVLLFAAVYALLLSTLGDALEAQREVGTTVSSRGGPMTLFMLASGIMGWVIVCGLEYSLGSTGFFQWPIAVLLSAVAVGLGVVCAKATGRPLPKDPDVLAAMCVFFAGVAGMCRVLYMRFIQ